MTHVRPPAFAGSFYPADPDELLQRLRECFQGHPLGPQGVGLPSSKLLGGMVPHAGYVYSGPCAAHFYSRLETDVDCVILLGVNHQGSSARASVSPASAWETPLGRVQVEQGLAGHLKGRVDFLADDEAPLREEHSIEVQLPFLQRELRSFTILPISLSFLSQEECCQLGRTLASLYGKGGGTGGGKAVSYRKQRSQPLPESPRNGKARWHGVGSACRSRSGRFADYCGPGANQYVRSDSCGGDALCRSGTGCQAGAPP